MNGYELPKPAIPVEDMTQPIGPLEQGDQALVDAANAIPAGEHMVEHDDGTHTRVIKHESLGDDIVIAQTGEADGSSTQADAMIRKIPGISAIDASTAEWPAGDGGGRTVDEVKGNDVHTGLFDKTHDREAAQAKKLEIAGKIATAGSKVEHTYTDQNS